MSGVIEGKNVILLVPGYDHEAWQNVVIANFNRDNRQVNVNANDRSDDYSGGTSLGWRLHVRLRFCF